MTQENLKVGTVRTIRRRQLAVLPPRSCSRSPRVYAISDVHYD